MKKILALFFAALFLCGCALSTIKPHKKLEAPQKAPEPPKKSIIQSIIKPAAPAPAPAPAEEVVVEEEEEKEEIK